MREYWLFSLSYARVRGSAKWPRGHYESAALTAELRARCKAQIIKDLLNTPFESRARAAPSLSAVLGSDGRVSQSNYAVFIGFRTRTHFLMRFFASIRSPKPLLHQLISMTGRLQEQKTDH